MPTPRLINFLRGFTFVVLTPSRKKLLTFFFQLLITSMKKSIGFLSVGGGAKSVNVSRWPKLFLLIFKRACRLCLYSVICQVTVSWEGGSATEATGSRSGAEKRTRFVDFGYSVYLADV